LEPSTRSQAVQLLPLGDAQVNRAFSGQRELFTIASPKSEISSVRDVQVLAWRGPTSRCPTGHEEEQLEAGGITVGKDKEREVQFFCQPTEKLVEPSSRVTATARQDAPILLREVMLLNLVEDTALLHKEDDARVVCGNFNVSVREWPRRLMKVVRAVLVRQGQRTGKLRIQARVIHSDHSPGTYPIVPCIGLLAVA
jgi:hypothetical protein